MDFFEWLGHIGGLPEILKIIAYTIVGSYLRFHSSIMHIGSIYRLKSNKTVFDKRYCKHHKHFLDEAQY